MTKINNEILIDLYNNDLLQKEIATCFNVYPQSIHKRVKKLGLKREPVYKPKFIWKERKDNCDKCKKKFLKKTPCTKYCPSCQKEMKYLNYEIYLETKKIRTKLRQLVKENYKEAIELVNDIFILEGLEFTNLITKDIIEVNV